MSTMYFYLLSLATPVGRQKGREAPKVLKCRLPGLSSAVRAHGVSFSCTSWSSRSCGPAAELRGGARVAGADAVSSPLAEWRKGVLASPRGPDFREEQAVALCCLSLKQCPR